MAGVAFMGEARIPRADPAKEAKTERVAALIQQLGHDLFAKRQAASKELESIGKPALPALREAAASSDSLETRSRAVRLIRAIAGPIARVELNSPYFSPGLPLPESKHAVYSVKIEAQVDAKGEGHGKLTLTVTPPNYDDYGDLVTGRETDGVDRSRKKQAPVVLACTIEFVKAGYVGRVNEPPIKRLVFRIKGPKITSSLLVATEGPSLTTGRLLVLGKDKRVEYVVALTDSKPKPSKREHVPVKPCHPGCFPAGTPVLIPDGSKRIELIRAGDTVTTIGPNGRVGRGVVESVFTTKNRLVEVRTDNGTVVTTDAQPLCPRGGGFQRAGDLKAGDRIWQWRHGRRVEATVREVVATGREVTVFNLILGDSAIFVAGHFLARGKPPAEGSDPALGRVTPMHPIGRGKD
jgi:hypothetical protein